nr:MAG TPA: minor structural protein [Caudoviricetes sp.]
MALKRSFLKGMGLTDEQCDSIIEAHAETVDGLKADLARYKESSGKAEQLQKDLEKANADLESAKKDGWKDKHDKVKKEFDDYKAGITAKETKAAKEKAVKAYYESKNITGDSLTIAMRGSGAEIEGIELDGDKIKDTAALDALVGGAFAKLVSTTIKTGASTATPPAQTPPKTFTRDDIRNMTPDEINKNFEAIKMSLKNNN